MLPIVSAITALDLPNGQSILLVIHEGIHNETSNHTLLSEFQLREFGVIIDSTCHRHGGIQKMMIKDNNNGTITVPLDLVGCMVHFKHRLPTTEEITSLEQYFLSQGDAPWSPSSFSDQVTDKFYQQVIDTENYNATLNDTMQPTDDAIDKVTQKMSFFYPSDSFQRAPKGKPSMSFIQY